jgi:hypothetical protein
MVESEPKPETCKVLVRCREVALEEPLGYVPFERECGRPLPCAEHK